MKTSLNEAKRLQRLAGINENLFSQDGSSSDSSSSSEDPTKSDSEESKNKVDTTSELLKQLMNVRQLLQSGDIKLDTKEITGLSNAIDTIVNKSNQGNAGNQVSKSVDYLNNITGNIGKKSQG